MKIFGFLLSFFSLQIYAQQNLSLGKEHICVRSSKNELKCITWTSFPTGDGSYLAVPKAYKESKYFKAGHFLTCAADKDEQTGCWGRGAEEFLRFLEDSPINGIYFTSPNSAIIHTNGKVRWWYSSKEQNLPALNGTYTKVFSALDSDTACFIDKDKKIICRNIRLPSLDKTFDTWTAKLQNTSNMSVNGTHVCAHGDDGITCLNYSANAPVQPPLSFRSSYSSAAYSQGNCTLDDGRVFCWSGSNLINTQRLATLGALTEIQGTANTLCATNNEKVLCLNASGNVELLALKPDASMQIPALSHVCHEKGSDLICFGGNNVQQLGYKSDAGATIVKTNGKPVTLDRDFKIKKHLTAIGRSCALSDKDQLSCWGVKDIDYSKVPMSNVHDFSLGNDFLCLINTLRDVSCYGKNFGTLPKMISHAEKIYSGGSTTCFIDDKGKTQCFGTNEKDLPIELPAFSQIAMGQHHSCGIKQDEDTLLCWGQNNKAQLLRGHQKVDDPDLRKPLPALLGNNIYVQKVACGSYHCCAITISNSLKCWGDNSFGQLGYGDIFPRGNAPAKSDAQLALVKMPQAEAVMNLDITGETTCVKTKSGRRCWGYNGNGQQATNNTLPRGNTPDTVPEKIPAMF